jgi:primosomal protein N' (replication factor Y)
MKSLFKERVLGPEYPVVRRVKNMYLKRITLKVEREANDKKVKVRLQEMIDQFYTSPSHKSVRVIVDVDPS